eukprot:351697-Chlamydomonas_euryale.AAC.11
MLGVHDPKPTSAILSEAQGQMQDVNTQNFADTVCALARVNYAEIGFMGVELQGAKPWLPVFSHTSLTGPRWHWPQWLYR